MTDEISQNNGNMATGQAISIARMEIPVSPEIDSWPDTTWHRGFTVIGQPDQAIEAETAFVLAQDVKGPGVTPVQVMRATHAVLPALELVDLKIEGEGIHFRRDGDSGQAETGRLRQGHLQPVGHRRG